VIAPLADPAEFVHAELTRLDEALGEVRHDERDVAALWNHRVVHVHLALPEPATVRVNVGDDLQAVGFTTPPDDIHFGRVEDDDALQGAWIDVVVGDEVGNVPLARDNLAQEKAAALADAGAAFTQLPEDLFPEAPRAVQRSRRAHSIVDTSDHG